MCRSNSFTVCWMWSTSGYINLCTQASALSSCVGYAVKCICFSPTALLSGSGGTGRLEAPRQGWMFICSSCLPHSYVFVLGCVCVCLREAVRALIWRWRGTGCSIRFRLPVFKRTKKKVYVNINKYQHNEIIICIFSWISVKHRRRLHIERSNLTFGEIELCLVAVVIMTGAEVRFCGISWMKEAGVDGRVK